MVLINFAKKTSPGSMRMFLNVLFVLIGVGNGWSSFLAEEALSSGQADAQTTIKLDTMPLSGGEDKNSEEKEVLEQKGLGSAILPDNLQEKSQKKLDVKRICNDYNKKIISYVGQAYYVDDCKRKLIGDSQLVNELVQKYSLSIIDVPAEIYRNIPVGSEFTRKNILSLEKNNIDSKDRKRGICQKYDKKYVTNDGATYFYVDKCKKHLFFSYEAMEKHNEGGAPAEGIFKEDLDELENGSVIQLKQDNESKILFRMDGDAIWSRLYRRNKKNQNAPDTVERLTQIDSEKRAPINKQNLCAELEGKFVSFYSKIYIIEKCVRRQILILSLEQQQKIVKNNGIFDVSVEQYRAIPEGNSVDYKDVYKEHNKK